MGKAGKVALVVLSVLYPCLVFLGLAVFKVQPRLVSLCMVLAVLLNFLSLTGERKASGRLPLGKLALIGVACVLIAVAVVANSGICLKLYPVFVSGTLLATFGATLARPPSMILRFATLQDRRLSEDPGYPGIVRYCRAVTGIWCGFFVFNIGMALYTAFCLSDFAWSLYNGLISYILIGVLFVGEMVVRRIVQKK
jgi:uncharacterized membrane protein